MQLILLYHFFHPDDVISARLFSDIAEEVARDGGSAVAMPSVRSCHDGEAAYVKEEEWNGVKIRRVWRPDWRQGSNKGRIGNALFMLLGWTWRAIWTRRTKNETVVIGTDPPLSVLVAIPWRVFRPRARIVHWCHDLYPQAAVAEGIFKADSWVVWGLSLLMRIAYARCDVIADLGACMSEELRVASGEERVNDPGCPSPPTPLPVAGRGETRSGSETLRVAGRGETEQARAGLGEVSRKGAKFAKVRGPKRVTLTPWALVEPARVLEADEEVRRELFGDAKLGLLYSGNLGRAHVYEPFVALARRVAGDSIAFCYAGRGAGMASLRAQLGDDECSSPSPPAPLPEAGRGESRILKGGLESSTLGLRVRFAGFASEEELGKRLGAADVHMVSLAPHWTGTVVPSKFFGALAVGRPVLFAGSRRCAIAQWIEEFDVGWVLDGEASVEQVAEQLRSLAAEPERMKALRERCFQVYHREFSKTVQLERSKRLVASGE